MALSKPSIAGQISGVLSGAEFAASKGRQIVKTSKIRRPRPSVNRLIAQAQQAAAIRYYLDLDDPYKRSWERAASLRPFPDRFGTPRTLSALQLFLTIPHDFRFSIPEYYEDSPPLLTNAFHYTVTATWTAPYDCRVIASTVGSPGDFDICALFASRFQRPGARNSRNWRKVGLLYAATNLNRDFDTSLEALNCAAISGETIRLRFQWYRHGFWPLWADIGQITVG